MSAITVGGRAERRARPAGGTRRARRATRPVRTSTSRSGSARSGAAARASTRCGTSSRPSAGAVRAGPRATISPMFLDDVRITVRAGAGGDGASTFRREAHVPRGGPDGGDGGRGGSIYLRVDAGQTDAPRLPLQAPVQGHPGWPRRALAPARQGRRGPLPRGPARARPSSTARPARCSRTSSRSARRSMVARGGRGGLGNTHFATATHQAPKHAQRGEPGEERTVRLELRLIADVGLVGPPERRQVHAARGPHRGDARRSRTIRSRRSSPTSASWTSAWTTGGGRRSRTCPG